MSLQIDKKSDPGASWIWTIQNWVTKY